MNINNNINKEHLSRHLTTVSNNINFMANHGAPASNIDMYRRLKITLQDELDYNDTHALATALAEHIGRSY